MNVKIESFNGHKRLIVKGNPYIMLAGEVHNSNSSCPGYMEKVWEKADTLGMNTLLLPVTWEMVEPVEGTFDFNVVDELILQARRYKKKVVFLWFGSWKNAQCMYAPEWVKTDLNRFKRAQIVKGENLSRLKDFHGMPYTTLSYLCKETLEADSKAFTALMAHIKSVDEDENTVIMVQVENETGLKGAVREHSDEADKAFMDDVPEAFVEFMKDNIESMADDVKKAVQEGKSSGSWEEVFGPLGEEIFTAYHVSGFVGSVASAGKEVYGLPMAANCWLDKGEKPGKYPTGGPVARMMEVWKYRAPAIDVIAPDIYVPDFYEVCDAYTKMDNPLFIPETATHSYAGARQVYVVGHYHAMCYSPFGFEEMGEPFSAVASYLFGVDTKDPALRIPQDVEVYGQYSRMLSNMMPLLTSRYGTDDLKAAICERPELKKITFDEFGFMINDETPMLEKKAAVCLAVKMEKNDFYLLISNCMLMPFSTNDHKPNIDILRLEEGRFVDGEWMAGRRLNGDEAMIMNFDKPTMLRIKLFNYK